MDITQLASNPKVMTLLSIAIGLLIDALAGYSNPASHPRIARYIGITRRLVALIKKVAGNNKAVTGLMIAAMALLMTGCGHDPTYNSQNYPDSLIIKAFEASGVNPTAFSKRIAAVVKAEILAKKFTKQQALFFIDKYKADLSNGTLDYSLVATIMGKYGKQFLGPQGEVVSQAAIIGYALFMPDLPTFQNIALPIGQQDAQIVGVFLSYMEKSIQTLEVSDDNGIVRSDVKLANIPHLQAGY